MAKLLPRTFVFSPRTTFISIALAVVMVWCATWQWRRYKEKSALVETYRLDSKVEAPAVTEEDLGRDDVLTALLERRVKLCGSYDYSHQVIVTNRSTISGRPGGYSGPGYWLITPFKVDGSNVHILVSRGFIPFSERSPRDWDKYSFDYSFPIEITGVLKKAPVSRSFGPQNPDIGPGHPFETKWLYPEASKMAKQLPYPVAPGYFLQLVGGPPTGEFPSEAISVEVPPTTHFGYTIEWTLLAIASLSIGFVLQAFPRRPSRMPDTAEVAPPPDVTLH